MYATEHVDTWNMLTSTAEHVASTAEHVEFIFFSTNFLWLDCN